MTARRTPWAALAAGLALALATPAAAEVYGAEAQQFTPATAPPTDFFTVRGATLLPPLTPVAGAYLHYAHRPLVYDDGVDSPALVGALWTMDLYAAMGIIDDVQVGLHVPFNPYVGGDAVPGVQREGLSGAGLRDLRLNGRYGLGDVPFVDHLRAVALLDFTLPLGAAGDFEGAGNVTLHPAIGLEYGLFERLRLGANFGWLLREQMRLDSAVTGHQFTWAFAGGYALNDQVEVIGELFGRVNADWAVDASAATSPAELDVGGRYTPLPGHHINALLGVGVNTGIGAPSARVLVGYTWEGPSYSDRDGDGIDDLTDACPDEPEDRDGFEDADGCPDNDNDKDGILEPVDACPNEPEDMDGFADADGCPDPDNDGDGTLDADDQCPREAGPPNRKGCPMRDQDGDGLRDDLDRCPELPEDMDGYLDADGCPDNDNDKDGILDKADQCPNEPETPNGFEDSDGCPDQVEAVRVTRERIEIMDRVQFNFGTADLTAPGRAVVGAVADALKAHPEILKVEIQGHTDDIGPKALNQTLSDDRAHAVRAALIQMGVAASRLTARGFGPTLPLDPANTRVARRKNRRVEFHIKLRAKD